MFRSSRVCLGRCRSFCFSGHVPIFLSVSGSFQNNHSRTNCSLSSRNSKGVLFCSSKTSQLGVKAERYRVSIPSSHSSGGGTSGRVSAFCLSRPTLNPSAYVPFLVQNCCQSILAGHQSFSNTQQSKWCILFLCLICFLSSFAFTECINFYLTMYQEKGEIYPTRVWERP